MFMKFKFYSRFMNKNRTSRMLQQILRHRSIHNLLQPRQIPSPRNNHIRPNLLNIIKSNLPNLILILTRLQLLNNLNLTTPEYLFFLRSRYQKAGSLSALFGSHPGCEVPHLSRGTVLKGHQNRHVFRR